MEDSTDKTEVPAPEEPAVVIERTDGQAPEEPVVIPPSLKLRLEKCPKCTYERRSGDDDFASPYECPKCGVVYALAMEEVRRKNRGQELQDEAEVDEMRRLAQAQEENIRSSQVGSAMFVGEERSWMWLAVVVALAGAAVCAYFFL